MSAEHLPVPLTCGHGPPAACSLQRVDLYSKKSEYLLTLYVDPAASGLLATCAALVSAIAKARGEK